MGLNRRQVVVVCCCFSFVGNWLGMVMMMVVPTKVADAFVYATPTRHCRPPQAQIKHQQQPIREEATTASLLFLSQNNNNDGDKNDTEEEDTNKELLPETDNEKMKMKTTKSNPNKNNNNNIGATSFNLIKVLLGSGVLALPSGVAAFSNHEMALTPAIILISILGVLSAYTFGLYGRLIHSTGANTLGELWEIEKGKDTSWIIAASSFTFCFGAALAYTILLGDVFSSLAKSAGFASTIVGQIGITRQFWILIVSSTIVYPLCNLKSLLALAPLSIAGVLSVLTTTGFLGWRCPLINPSSPYSSSAGGQFLKAATAATRQAATKAMFGTYNKGILSASSMVLIGMAATAYLGHFSAPGFYHSLKGSKDDDGNATDAKTTTNTTTTTTTTLSDYYKVTVSSFSVCTIVNCLVMAFGFLTFGGQCQGVILNNYSTKDIGASICRLLMAICVTGGYPFLIGACRTEILDLLVYNKKSKNKNKNNNITDDDSSSKRILERKVTTILLLILTGTALIVENAGFVIGLTGAVAGSLIGYSFPAQLFLSNTSRKKGQGKQQYSRSLQVERIFCRILVGFGIVSSAIGGGVSLIDNFWPNLL